MFERKYRLERVCKGDSEIQMDDEWENVHLTFDDWQKTDLEKKTEFIDHNQDLCSSVDCWLQEVYIGIESTVMVWLFGVSKNR